tara:strand:+ start:16481 stop:17047 length:567 start_codon:yes stop_codon:yes gene_type:complete
MENWGIYITNLNLDIVSGDKSPEGKKDRTMIALEKRGPQIAYNITAGKYDKASMKKGKFFVTNPAIRKALQEANRPLTEIGFFKVVIDHVEKIIITSQAYPTEFSSLSKLLKKIGVGTLVERAIEKDLLKYYPDFKIRSTRYPKRDRREQLKKRGRTHGEAIPLREAAELTRQQIINQHKKNSRRKLR